MMSSVNNNSCLNIFKDYVYEIKWTLFIVGCVAACVFLSIAAHSERSSSEWTLLSEEGNFEIHSFHVYSDLGAFYISAAVTSSLGAAIGVCALIKHLLRKDQIAPGYGLETDLSFGEKTLDAIFKFLILTGTIALFATCIYLAVRAGHEVYINHYNGTWWWNEHDCLDYTSTGSEYIAGSFFAGLGGTLLASLVLIPAFSVDEEPYYYPKEKTLEDIEKINNPHFNPEDLKKILLSNEGRSNAHLGPWRRQGYFNRLVPSGKRFTYLNFMIQQTEKYHRLQCQLDKVDSLFPIPSQPIEPIYTTVSANEDLHEEIENTHDFYFKRAENSKIRKRNDNKDSIRRKNQKKKETYNSDYAKWQQEEQRQIDNRQRRKQELTSEIEQFVGAWRKEASTYAPATNLHSIKTN